MGSEVIAHRYLRDVKLWYSSERMSHWRKGTFRSEQKWNDIEIDERMDKLRLTWIENETPKPKMLKYSRNKKGRRKELLDWRLEYWQWGLNFPAHSSIFLPFPSLHSESWANHLQGLGWVREKVNGSQHWREIAPFLRFFCPFIKKEKQFYSKMPLREDSGLPITKIAFPLLKSPKCSGFPSLDHFTPILCSHGSAGVSVLSLSTQGWSRPSRLVKVMRE